MAAPATAPRQEVPARRLLQLALAAAAVGALMILLSLFGPAGNVVGLVLIVAGAILTAPAAGGGNWWTLLAIGAAFSILAALVQLGSDTLGGMLAVIGGVLILTGVSLGFPLADD